MGARSLAEALQVNSAITKLGLDRNSIFDEGARALADMLLVNASVTELRLESNRISDAGVGALAAALHVNYSVTTLNLGENCVSSDLEARVRRLVQINRESSSKEEADWAKDAEFGLPSSREEIAEDSGLGLPPLVALVPFDGETADQEPRDREQDDGAAASKKKFRFRRQHPRRPRTSARLNPSANSSKTHPKRRPVPSAAPDPPHNRHRPSATGTKPGHSSAGAPAKKASKFYAKLVERDERNVNFKISELIPLIKDTHDAVLFYTLVNFVYKSQGITTKDRSRYVTDGLRVASATTSCTESVALFKLLLRKASEDGALSDMEREMLDREAEVTHTSHAPFVLEISERIRTNAARIDGLEANAEALGNSIERLKAGIRRQWKVQAAVGLAGAVLNAVSFGAAGSALSGAVNLAIGSIVDFGDVVHIESVVASIGDASVKEAFEAGLSLVEDTYADEKLLKAASEGNPIVTIAYAAKVIDDGGSHQYDNTNNSRGSQAGEAAPTDDSPVKKKPTAPLIARLKWLEDQLSPAEVAPSVSGRVSCLEELMFGTTQDGTLVERVAHLEKELGID